MLVNGTTSNSAREETSTQKRPFKSPVAVHTTPAETGNFASSIETGQGLNIGPQDTTREVRFHSSQGFACQDREPHCDQWSSGRVEKAVRPGDTNQLIADIGSCPTNGHDLGIFPEWVGDLAIAGDDDSLQFCLVDQFLASQGIHPLYQFRQRLAHKKVHPVLHKCLDWSRRARKRSTQRF